MPAGSAGSFALWLFTSWLVRPWLACPLTLDDSPLLNNIGLMYSDTFSFALVYNTFHFVLVYGKNYSVLSHN